MPTSLRRPHPNPPGRRRGDIGRGLGAVAVLALMIAGLPMLVIHFTGLPNLSQPPGGAEVGQLLTGPDTGRLLAVVLAAVFWLAWSAFVALVLLETFALIGRRQPVRLPAFGPMQELARTLVACVALLSVPATVSLTNPPAAPPTLAVALTPAVRQHAAPEHDDAAAKPATHQRDRPAVPARPAMDRTATTPSTASRPAAVGPTYEVLAMHNGQRDTLWRIAEQHLRDPLRWPEIYQLNAGKPQPDGAALTDPHWIRPGWLLLLPADATGLPAPPTSGNLPAPPPATGGAPHPGGPSGSGFSVEWSCPHWAFACELTTRITPRPEPHTRAGSTQPPSTERAVATAPQLGPSTSGLSSSRRPPLAAAGFGPDTLGEC